MSAALSRFDCDVLVVGGAPGGSTVGAPLVERGREVVILDKAHHPRCPIGESSLQAGDTVGSTPMRRDVRMSKRFRPPVPTAHPRRTGRARLQRRRNIPPSPDLAGA